MFQSHQKTPFDGFAWAVAQNFAFRLTGEFKDFPKGKYEESSYRIILDGAMKLGSPELDTRATAKCLILVNAGWMASPPYVCCTEHWLRKGDNDWHASSTGDLCWDYHTRWKDTIQAVADQSTIGKAAEYGAASMLRSVRNLLNRHLWAYRTGEKVWQKEWDYWPHNPSVAAKEYTANLINEYESSI